MEVPETPERLSYSTPERASAQIPTPQVANACAPGQYIFIVGLSRSGTSLMRKILNRSGQVAICKENHFLGHLLASEGARYKFRRFAPLADDENVRKLVNFLYDGGLERSSRFRGMSAQWRWMQRAVKRKEFLRRVLESSRTERDLFDIMMRLYAEHMGRTVLGEKTPAHVRYVPILLEWFPQAKILHMLRDPRGIFVSELRRRQALAVTPPYRQLRHFPFLLKVYILAQTTFLWLEGARLSRKYQRLYRDNYFVLRFEDLVQDPETHIRRLCEFSGIRFQSSMLSQRVVSRGFRVGTSGFDADAADRWKKQIDPWINSWFAWLFDRQLKNFSYSH